MSNVVPFAGADDTLIGPALNQDIMREALLLQNYIINELNATYNGTEVKLKDICFKPLAPDYDECAVQSIFQYFQVLMESLWFLPIKASPSSLKPEAKLTLSSK